MPISAHSTPEAIIRLHERAIYRGAHVHGRLPMVRVRLGLEGAAAATSAANPGFIDRLLTALPGVAAHRCSLGRPGGFATRLHDGTGLAHVIEHVALELQAQCGAGAARGKTRSVPTLPNGFDVLIAYQHEAIALAALRMAVALVAACLDPPARVEGLARLPALAGAGAGTLARPDAVAEALAMLRREAGRLTFGPSTQALVREARRRRIPVERLDDHSFVQLGTGRWQQRLRAALTSRTAHLAVTAASDKALTKRLLARAGVPVPGGVVVHDAEAAVAFARRVPGGVVVKPLAGNQGRGVSLDLRDADSVRSAFLLAARHGGPVVVEPHLQGQDYRVLVVGAGVVAVAQRTPAHVIGDGRSTVATLVAHTNADPRRSDGHTNLLTRIRLDAQVDAQLARQGLTRDSVPAAGRHVRLRATANLSTGGTATDCTALIHPANRLLAIRAAQAVGLDVAGIDIIAPDIARPIIETGGGVVEVNASPGLRMHLAPSHGTARSVARPVLRHLFPPGQPVRVPVLAVTGTNGKSTTVAMLRHILNQAGLVVGAASSQGVSIGGHRISGGDATGPRSARLVLADPTIDIAVLETARGGILREGVGYGRADVGAVLNIAADHLGQGGVATLRDLARVKAVVARSVVRHGTCVLNADDPLVARMARMTEATVCYFSLQPADRRSRRLIRHIAEGGPAVTLETIDGAGWIVAHRDGAATALLPIDQVPASWGGQARFQVANALAAVAMARAAGTADAAIGAGLRSFASSFDDNPGRMNMIEAHGVRIVLDYAHNAAGLVALGQLVDAVRPGHRRVLGMVSIPGDRRDEDVVALARVAAGLFDVLVVREADALRGRPPGQVLELLHSAACSAPGRAAQIHAERHEAEAIRRLLGEARSGDLVMITATDITAAWGAMLDFAQGLAA